MKAILASALLVGIAAIKSTSAYSATSSWYWPETGNQGACGGFIKNGDWVVALDARHYDRGGVCGKMIRITANGRTQVARIGDRCEMCRQVDGIDMTPELFASFANRDVGIISVTWEFVDGNNNGGHQQQPKPEPPKPQPQPPKQEPPKEEWKPPQEEWKPPKEEWKPPKEEWKPPKEEWKPPQEEWKPPKEEWKPPAETPKQSQPAWTPPASNTPAPSPSQDNNHNSDNNRNDGSSIYSPVSSSAVASPSNATSTQTASTGQNHTSSAIAASSTVSEVAVSLTPHQNGSIPATRHALAHLHQAVLQVASLVVEAAEAI